MIWRRLTTLVGALRAQMMVEIERNPLAVRQGAAAAACIVIAAAAMPVIAHRAEQQRDGGETAQATRYETQIASNLFERSQPDARLELVVASTNDGLRARGQGLLASGIDTHAMLVQASLRGPMADAPTAPGAINPRELRCLSEAVYYEARGESYQGQVAVAEVVVNRAHSRVYPTSICGVVYQGSHRATGCQFTFTCDGSINRSPRGQAWARSQYVARQVLSGFERPLTSRATHYHTTAVNPYWSSNLIETGRIGTHIFYRLPSRAERAALMASGQWRRAPVYSAGSGAGRVTGVIPDGVDDAVEADGVDDAAPPAAAAPAPADEVATVTPVSATSTISGSGLY